MKEPKPDVPMLKLMNVKQVPTKVGWECTYPKGTRFECCSKYKNSWILGGVQNQATPEMYLNYKYVADL